MRAGLLLALASACAIPDEKLGAYACVGAPDPTTAPAEIAVSGVVKDPFAMGNGVVGGLTVASQPSGGFTAMTDSAGEFSATLMTGGVPSTDSLKISGTGYVDAYYYPAESIAGDAELDSLQVYMPEELAMIGSAAGVPIGSDTQQLVISVEDCAGDPVDGATINADSGTVVYFNGYAPDPTATMTGPPTGAAIVLGVTMSTVTIGATTPQQGFHPHSANVMPGTLSETAIQP
jgi:hypothetical protein